MGDLNVERQGVNSRGARLRFEQGTVNSEYLMHLYLLFQSYCGSPPRESTSLRSQTGCTRGRIRFNTLTSPIFNEYRDLFYSNGVKIVPPTIGELLTARGLAYWATMGIKTSQALIFVLTLSLARRSNSFVLPSMISLILSPRFSLTTASQWSIFVLPCRTAPPKFCASPQRLALASL
jgi:hypothetical protein